MDADAVRALVDPDIEWRNTGLPSVRGSKRVELALTIVSRLITRYEVVEVLTMTTDHNTVSSRRREIIRIGWFAMHLDVDGHYTFANGLPSHLGRPLLLPPTAPRIAIRPNHLK